MGTLFLFKVGTHEGTCCKVPATNPIVWTLNFHEKSCCGDEILSARHVPWIQISLNWGDMSRRQNNVTLRLHARSPRVNCSCNMSPRHFRKINQSENEIATCPCDKTLRVNTSRNLSPQHAPSCEQRMKFFPATCPCNMSPRVCRPLRAFLLTRKCDFLTSFPGPFRPEKALGTRLGISLTEALSFTPQQSGHVTWDKIATVEVLDLRWYILGCPGIEYHVGLSRCHGNYHDDAKGARIGQSGHRVGWSREIFAVEVRDVRRRLLDTIDEDRKIRPQPEIREILGGWGKGTVYSLCIVRLNVGYWYVASYKASVVILAIGLVNVADFVL